MIFRFNISPRPFAFGRGADGAAAAPCGPSLFLLNLNFITVAILPSLLGGGVPESIRVCDGQITKIHTFSFLFLAGQLCAILERLQQLC